MAELLVGELGRTVDQPGARLGLVLAGASARCRERGGGVAKPALPRPPSRHDWETVLMRRGKPARPPARRYHTEGMPPRSRRLSAAAIIAPAESGRTRFQPFDQPRPRSTKPLHKAALAGANLRGTTLRRLIVYVARAARLVAHEYAGQARSLDASTRWGKLCGQ